MADPPDLSTDPFTQIYEALWLAFESRPSFTAMVKAGNRLSYTGLASRIMKSSLQPADAPQLRIMPGGGSARQTSTGWIGPARYVIDAFSGSLKIDQYYFPLKWEIYKALWVAQIRREPLGLSFVSRLQMEDIAEGFDDVIQTGGGQGWFGIVAVVVDINLDRTLLEE